MAGGLKMELSIGGLRIPGGAAGAKMALLESKKGKIFLELKVVVLGHHLLIHGLMISEIKQLQTQYYKKSSHYLMLYLLI